AGFAGKREEFAAIVNTSRIGISLLLADVAACLPIDEFVFPALSIAEEETLLISFAQDALKTVQVVIRECDRRLKTASDQAAIAAGGGANVKALQAAAKGVLGAGFVVIPEFAMGAAQADEIASAIGASPSLLDYLLGPAKAEQPVDTWMYGVARVRERIRDWEQIVMLGGALTGSETELTPLQLPFGTGGRWLALGCPPETKLDQDRLLYTGHFAAPFDRQARQCGLLLDEWNETIPAHDTTSGLTFHYDRPNNEAPQAMLLVTPTAFRGAWQWKDLVDALTETLHLAKTRAVEPVHVDTTPYAQLLPATLMAVTKRQLTISANVAMNNDLTD